MLSKNYIISVAQKADFPPTFIKQLKNYLDFAEKNKQVRNNLENYYHLLFKSGEDFFPIVKVRDIPICELSRQKHPGFFETVIFLAASKHFEKFVSENGLQNCKYNLIDTYYKNLRRFGEMNFVRDNTYSLIRHGYFLYGYAKPFILHIGRLSYELREYDATNFNIYETHEGERVFIKNGDTVPDTYKKIINHGKPYVTIHIPGNDKLSEEAILDSIETATPILKKVFEKYNPKHFLCASWLISPQLDSFLKPNSNIKAFANMFHRVLGDQEPNALYEHIFKCPICPINELVPQNNFQKSILSLYKNGEGLCNGIGILKKEFCKL